MTGRLEILVTGRQRDFASGRLENLVTGRQREFASGHELLDSIASDLEPSVDDRSADRTRK